MLNKKRLAALSLSAVMAASTVSFPVNAADFSDRAGVSAEAQTETPSVTEETTESVKAVGQEVVDTTKTIAFDEKTDEIIYYVTVDGVADPNPRRLKADRVNVKEATCTEAASYQLQAQLPGESSPRLSTAIKVGEPLGHQIEEKTDILIGAGNCDPKDEKPAIYRSGKYCTREDKWIEGEYTDKEADAQHQLDGKAIVKYEAKKSDNVKLENDKPVLIDPAKDGTYTEVTYETCTKCGTEVETKRETKTLTATENPSVTEKNRVVLAGSQKNIADGQIKDGMDVKNIPAEDKIQLKDCSKDGSYTVNVISKDNSVIYSYEVTVKAHHTAGKPEVKAVNADGTVNEADTKLLTVKYDKDGNVENVINNDCTHDITYTITVKCVVDDKVMSQEKKVAAKSTTNHVIDKDIQKTVQDAKDKGTTLTQEQIKAFEGEKYVKVVPETATCKKAGTVSIEFYCHSCGTKVATISGVKSEALGHLPAAPVVENAKEATCTTPGSYDLVTKCERDGEVLKTVHVEGKRLPHTNETVTSYGDYVNNTSTDNEKSEVLVDLVGNRVIGKYKVGDVVTSGFIGSNKYQNGQSVKGIVSAKVYTNCGICHNHVVEMNGYDAKQATITVTSIKPDTYDKFGNLVTPGTIGLKASYTRADGKTVVTAESTVMYISKSDVDIPDEFKSGLEKDDDGVYRYYVNGKFDSSFVGIADYNGQKFFVTKGIMDNKATGLNSYDGKWYYLSEGRVTSEYTGLVQYDGQWFYVSNGVMDSEKSGLVEYNGGTFLFIDGRKADEVNGLWLDSTTGTWYFLANGQVQTQHTGVAMYDGAFFYIQKGELAKDYKGTVTYDGKKFNVVEGQLYGPIK